MRKCLCKVAGGSAILPAAPPDRIVLPHATPATDPAPAPILDLTEIAVVEFVAAARQIAGSSSLPGHFGAALTNLVTCRMSCDRAGESFDLAVEAALRPGGRLEDRLGGALSATLRDDLRRRIHDLLVAIDALSRTV